MSARVHTMKVSVLFTKCLVLLGVCLVIHYEIVTIFFTYIHERRLKLSYDSLFCTIEPQDLHGNVALNLRNMSMDDVAGALANQSIAKGGSWRPKHCLSRDRVAVLIPYRDRESHLKSFLVNMHPIFARQKIDYKVYLIEPIAGIPFNRGLLLNIGFVESNKEYNWDCHVYHDVDMLSEDDRTLYSCSSSPYHLSHFLSRRNYTIPTYYTRYFGGASLLTKDHFILANGYSNLYFGWGKEDDDHRRRIEFNRLKINSPSELPIGKYFTQSHRKASKNPLAMELYYFAQERFKTDGLNSLKYDVIYEEVRPLYTKLHVYYNKTAYMQVIKFGRLEATLQRESTNFTANNSTSQVGNRQ